MVTACEDYKTDGGDASRYQCDCSMMGLNCLLILAVVIQIIKCQEFGQGPPPGQGFPDHKCARPPPSVKNPQECCVVKPMYTEEELAECGFQKIDDKNRLPHGPPDCSKPECLLQKKNFLNEDRSIRYDDMKTHMEDWVKSNMEFEGPVETVKSVCMGENGPPGPPHICEANRLMFCTGAIFFSECPTWQDTDECKLLKDHINECKNQKIPPPN